MTDGIIGALIGMGSITVVNVVTVAFFYGKLCGRVDANTWKISKLWTRVFNNTAKGE
uniref:Uncharacterized protein n=1 Tax=viral metagenome TaxID=1070528 RepID=A0A6M3XSR5_9ZZZZ